MTANPIEQDWGGANEEELFSDGIPVGLSKDIKWGGGVFQD